MLGEQVTADCQTQQLHTFKVLPVGGGAQFAFGLDKNGYRRTASAGSIPACSSSTGIPGVAAQKIVNTFLLGFDVPMAPTAEQAGASWAASGRPRWVRGVRFWMASPSSIHPAKPRTSAENRRLIQTAHPPYMVAPVCQASKSMTARRLKISGHTSGTLNEARLGP